jgi:GTP:adenosylcobinamide-phosphate guanylyltransferase
MRITQKDIAEAADIDFKEQEEQWNIYKLSDGTTLKVKLVLTGVKRLNKYSEDGEPIYLIRSNNVVRTVNTPQELKMRYKEPPSTMKPV